MCKEKDKFKNEPQSWEHVFYIRNTNTIAIKKKKKKEKDRDTRIFCENTTKFFKIYLVLLFCLLLHHFFQDQFAVYRFFMQVVKF